MLNRLLYGVKNNFYRSLILLIGAILSFSPGQTIPSETIKLKLGKNIPDNKERVCLGLALLFITN